MFLQHNSMTILQFYWPERMREIWSRGSSGYSLLLWSNGLLQLILVSRYPSRDLFIYMYVAYWKWNGFTSYNAALSVRIRSCKYMKPAGDLKALIIQVCVYPGISVLIIDFPYLIFNICGDVSRWDHNMILFTILLITEWREYLLT